ncbi:chromosome segregation SMC family protein [Paracoccus sp. MC1862]|uniref:chromosome segregation SMC family protein n=1 Tax=Paracoccus sp. MC1862 TaxID=2760307 RepID=UPI001600A868|nr:AAA family ATPase [Paracoccus sp. MC1862]MBB1498332.1 AAA family ATPase [Paracoccus sp. MC1862]QQO44912.1 AAA family ATPase [Paracoccus sp. MC1862]
MQFDRLRLSGFKSFVDPTELVILQGLTGVVGPNGCGKSNLLEALRWVMGESRPTAMRGDGMEDVIFAGTTRRPAKGRAEVTLALDNRARLAPVGFNDADTLDVTRRITRDAGSAYRINGREVRARDVQMLFADASTGAQSPALVRQGQISELINARPKARRRVLEEAAGIGGLYQRRHEAELRLNGAEQNLTRVDDTLEQLAAQAAALARQARTAARYREIGAALRRAEGALVYRRWSEAQAALTAALTAFAEARATAAQAEAAARAATTARAQAEAALPALRDEDSIAAAIQARAAAEAEALDDAEARARDTLATLTARLAQLDRDSERESALNRDAGEVLARLTHEREELEQADAGHEDRLAAAQIAAEDAATALRGIEARLGELTDEAARLAARHQSAERLVADLRVMRERAERAQTEAEAAVTRAEAAGREAEATLAQAQAAQEATRAAATQAEARLSAAETDRAAASDAETAARATRAHAEGEAAALEAERSALSRLLARGRAEAGALLDALTVAPGFEVALGAALGDDLRLPVTDEGLGWRTLSIPDDDPALPEGAAPLGAQVQGAPALSRRLAQIGLVADAASAARMQPHLRPGQRLVTRAGDLFRWDGLALPAGEATSAAALHLQQVNRLKDTIAQAESARTRADAAIAIHETARAALKDATGAETSAREASRAAERALSDSLRAATRADSDLSLAQGRAEAARAERARHAGDAADAARRLAEARAALSALPDRSAAATAVDQAKTAVEAARIATLSRHGALDELRREGEGRLKRLEAIAKDASGWRQRLDQAGTRAAELQARRDVTAAELAGAEVQPAILAQRRAALSQRVAEAEVRLARARAALAAGDAALLAAAGAERDAERAASAGREARATREARADAAREAEAQARARIAEDTDGTPPEALAQTLGDTDAPPPSAQLESDISRLRTQRDVLGPVNLRAEEDKRVLEEERARLAAEKDDLTAAIARLRAGIGSLNREGRERLLAAFDTVNASFGALFTHLFGGGEARLVLVESDDPLEAGLEILAQPPGKKLATLSLLSGGEQTLTALALIFAVFLATPAPICVLDEVDAPLDDANVTRFCDLLDEMTRRTDTRFLIITHHAVTMARMDRLFGVTMVEPGVSQLVSVDLRLAEALVA